MMSGAPRGAVQENVLAPLLAPHRDIARKRVTMLYRPIDPARAASIVDADIRVAEQVLGQSARTTGRNRKDFGAALNTDNEAADGAGLLNFGMVVTATVEDPAVVADARAAVDTLSAQARILLRPVYGSQDSAFAAGLPLGLVLPDHLAIPRANCANSSDGRDRSCQHWTRALVARRRSAPSGSPRPPRRRRRAARRRSSQQEKKGRCGARRAVVPTSERTRLGRSWPRLRRPGPAGSGVAWHDGAGLRPLAFAVGAGRQPISGVPLGLHLDTGATVCGDPISWFQAGIINNPSIFVLGLPGLGKSTLVRRMCVGGEGMGYLPLVLGDLKPDYVDMVYALKGQVITLGRGRGHLNILDPGGAIAAAQRLRESGHEKEAAQGPRRRPRASVHDGVRAADDPPQAGTVGRGGVDHRRRPPGAR